MLSLSSKDKVYLCAKAIDFRNQTSGLIRLTQGILEENPFSQNYFVFVNRGKTAIKILHYDGQGYCMLLKRLSKGKFSWPSGEGGKIKLAPMELQILFMNGLFEKAKIQENWINVA
jgi:transposase